MIINKISLKLIQLSLLSKNAFNGSPLPIQPLSIIFNIPHGLGPNNLPVITLLS